MPAKATPAQGGDSGWFCRFAASLGYPDEKSPQFVATVGSSDPVLQLRYFAEQGFAGADDPFLLKRPVEQQLRIGRELERLGLEFGNAVCSAGTARQPLWGRSDADAIAGITREVTEVIEGLRRVGGRCFTVITGLEPRQARAYQVAALIDNLRRMVPLLESADVVLCLESMSERRIPQLLLNDLGDAYVVCRAVDSPHVRLVFDTLLVQQAHGDLIENLRAVWNAVAAVQISDNPGRLEPGSGEINFVNFLAELHALGHRGLVCLEHVLASPGVEGEQAALRNLRAIDAAVRAHASGGP